MTTDPGQTTRSEEQALGDLLLAVRRFLYPLPTVDALELQVSRSIAKLVEAFHAWETAEVSQKSAPAEGWVIEHLAFHDRAMASGLMRRRVGWVTPEGGIDDIAMESDVAEVPPTTGSIPPRWMNCAASWPVAGVARALRMKPLKVVTWPAGEMNGIRLSASFGALFARVDVTIEDAR